MKFVFRLILFCIALSFLLNIIAIELQSGLNRHKKHKSHKRHQKHHSVSKRFSRDDAALKREPDEADCGCKIVYSFNEEARKPKTKAYKRRWPLPAPIPAPPVIPKPPVVCDSADGAAFLSELRKLFPPSISQHVPKKKVVEAAADGTVTTTTTHSTTTTATGPPTGIFTKGLFDQCRSFKERVINDLKPNHIGVKHSRTGRKKLTAEEIFKLEQSKHKEAFLKRNRAYCYSKLRTYLENGYSIPYKGQKCHTIGRLLSKCVVL